MHDALESGGREIDLGVFAGIVCAGTGEQQHRGRRVAGRCDGARASYERNALFMSLWGGAFGYWYVR